MTFAPLPVVVAALRCITTAGADNGPVASYYKDGQIHVNVLGTPEEEPLKSGRWDFKPSWSKTGGSG